MARSWTQIEQNIYIKPMAISVTQAKQRCHLHAPVMYKENTFFLENKTQFKDILFIDAKFAKSVSKFINKM